MSYFDLSLQTAEKAYTWGWRLSLAAAMSSALGILLLMWVARVREQDFQHQVARLHSRAATSEERAAALQREAAELRLQFVRASFEQKEIAPPARMETAGHQRLDTANAALRTSAPPGRHVSPEQQTSLTTKLRDFRSRVVLRFEPNQEAAEYAVTLRDAFTRVGIPVTFGSAARASGLTGIRMAMIMTPGEGEPLPAAKEMSNFLQESGIPLERPIHWRAFPAAEDEPATSRSRSDRPADVQIFVGEKPLMNIIRANN